MITKDIENDESIVQEQFNQWLVHPTTQLLVDAIYGHRAKFIEAISKNAEDMTISDSALRHKAVALRTIDAILRIITNKETMKGLTK